MRSFSCGTTEGECDLNEFLTDDALRVQGQGVAQVYLARCEGVLAGYVAISTDAIHLKFRDWKKVGLKKGDPRSVPALKVGRLAVSKEFRSKCRGLGEHLMRAAVVHALAISKRVGCRLVTVDAYPDAIGFYEKLGFVRNKIDAEQPEPEPESSTPSNDFTTVSMRFDLLQPDLPAWVTAT